MISLSLFGQVTITRAKTIVCASKIVKFLVFTLIMLFMLLSDGFAEMLSSYFSSSFYRVLIFFGGFAYAFLSFEAANSSLKLLDIYKV